MSAADGRGVVPRTVVGRNSATYLVALLYLMMVVLGVLIAVEHGVSLGLRIAFALFGAVFAVLTVRRLTVKVDVGPDGLTIRNNLSTHHVPWSDVRGFETVVWCGFPRPTVQLNAGGQITLMALEPPLGETRRTTAWIAELNTELAKVRPPG